MGKYQHRCLDCGKLFEKEGKYAFTCDECKLKKMTECTECHKEVPEEFSQLMAFQGGYISPCPRCALRIRNETHGLPLNTPFEGELAKEIYERFVKEFPEVEDD